MQWNNPEDGQYSSYSTFGTLSGQNKLDMFHKMEKARLDSYKSFLISKGMSADDADAFIFRMSFLPLENPGAKRDDFIGEDWLKRNTFKKSQKEWPNEGLLADDIKQHAAQDVYKRHQNNQTPDTDQNQTKITIKMPQKPKSMLGKIVDFVTSNRSKKNYDKSDLQFDLTRKLLIQKGLTETQADEYLAREKYSKASMKDRLIKKSEAEKRKKIIGEPNIDPLSGQTVFPKRYPVSNLLTESGKKSEAIKDLKKKLLTDPFSSTDKK